MRGFTMPSGKVKWFNAKKGYGFITDDETQKDIFLHVSSLESSKFIFMLALVNLRRRPQLAILNLLYLRIMLAFCHIQL